jgi:hypothetical protein
VDLDLKLKLIDDPPGDHRHVSGGIDLRRKVSHRGLIAWTADSHVDERGRRRDLLVVPVLDHADVALRVTRGDRRRTLRLGVSPTNPT